MNRRFKPTHDSNALIEICLSSDDLRQFYIQNNALRKRICDKHDTDIWGYNLTSKQTKIDDLYKISITIFLSLSSAAGMAQKPMIDEHAAAHGFSKEKRLLNETTDAYSRRSGNIFPKEPASYFNNIETARRLMRDDNYKSAIPLLEHATQEYRDNGDIWGLLGVCKFKISDWMGAVAAFDQALVLGVTPWDMDIDLNPNDMMIAIAKAYAQAGDKGQAITWLKKGLELRYDERPDLAAATEFSSLKDQPEFNALVGSLPEGTFTRDEQWRYDIRYLGELVAQLHADPDHHTPALKLKQMLSDLSAAVPSLSDEEITAKLDLFIGALGGGHDIFWPVSPKRGALLPFALKLYQFTDGLYIIDAYDPDFIGARVDAFGKTPSDEAYAKVAKAFPGDNDMEAQWMGVRHLTQAYTLEALNIIENQASASLTITGRDGEQRVITPQRRAFGSFSPALKAPPGAPLPLYLSGLDKIYWMQKLEDLNTLYVQVNRVGDGETESFAKFAKRMGREAEKPDIRNLILDLRHSPGGNGYLTPPLLRELIRFNASPNKGRLYVIIGRNTFSASQNMITDLDRLATPIFVGEPSGSRPNALSESGNFKLPFSGLTGFLSSQLHQHSWPEDHRIWIAPDVPVGLTSKDFFSGHDPALEAISILINADSRF
jgi:tetratricopeptide (TPR) repeat protein